MKLPDQIKKPVLRLFFSVDLVGSTALKQKNDRSSSDSRDKAVSSPGWISDFLGFYSDFQECFSTNWAQYASRDRKFSGWNQEPELWKANGDELIYTKVIGSPKDLSATLCCWLSAVRQYRVELRRLSKQLDLKASAWTAGFPIKNSEVILGGDASTSDPLMDPYVRNLRQLIQWHGKRGKKVGLVRDFIGPSLDIGFRVSGLATPRKMTITPEIALILSSIHHDEEDGLTHPLEVIDVKYYGATPLKGVYSGKPYPVFWIDTTVQGDLDRLEDKIMVSEDYNNLDIRNFCEKFFSETSGYFLRPFIVCDGKLEFGTFDGEYRKNLDRFIQKCERAIASDNIRSRAFNDEDAPATKSTPPAINTKEQIAETNKRVYRVIADSIKRIQDSSSGTS